MDTLNATDCLSATLFGKTRRAVLALLYGHADEAFYLREIVRVAGLGLGAVQREVKGLTQAGIIRRTARGHQVYYQADAECPIFAELRSVVTKTSGIGDVLRAALAPLADQIRLACIYGSVARGKEVRGSDVDMLVVGDVAFSDVAVALGRKQRELGREINPTVYPPAEFRAKMAAGHHFLTQVARGTKVFLIGDERELARLAKERLAGRARNESPGDRRSSGRGRSRLGG
ncbi:MAG: nucleotidyltransferase domain-containing protein [Pirellulales bacterium]